MPRRVWDLVRLVWVEVGFRKRGFFRLGSNAEVQREPQNVGSWGQSRHRFRAAGCLLVAITGPPTFACESGLAPAGAAGRANCRDYASYAIEYTLELEYGGLPQNGD